MRKFYIFSITLFVMGCASQGGVKSYESLSQQCDKNNYNACFDAADKIFNLRSTSLKACGENEIICIQPGEDRKSAMMRITELGLAQNKISCEEQQRGEACLRVGSVLSGKSSRAPVENYKPIAAEAEKYFELSCKLGTKLGCMMRGTTYRVGT